jgi:hypothetical protein
MTMVLVLLLLAGPEEGVAPFFGAGAARLLLDEQASSEKTTHSVSPIATFRKVRCLDRVWSLAWFRLIEKVFGAGVVLDDDYRHRPMNY